MKRTLRRFFVFILVFALLLGYFPATVRATHGFSAHEFTIIVDGQLFSLWGYDGDGPVPAFRLQDIAYMLSGTAAQFDIRVSEDESLDYWIIRGASYTPVGTEFAPILEDRWAIAGSLGFFDWYGFDDYPVQSVVLGFDGGDAPLMAASLRVIRDVDYTYFPVEILGLLIGFSLDFVWDEDGHHYEIATGTITPIELPIQSAGFARLMSRLAGHWVDSAHYYSGVIDESTVWPVELDISVHGITDAVALSVAPGWVTTWPQWWYPLSVRELENGLVELIVEPGTQAILSWHDAIFHVDAGHNHDPGRFGSHRIIADTTHESINEIIYYIGDTPHTMTRFDWNRETRRYNIDAAEGGGIRLTYVLVASSIVGRQFMVYRSVVPGERGDLIHNQQVTDYRDSLHFQFIDTTAEHGQVYYYTFMAVDSWGPVDITPSIIYGQQIVVDVNAVLGEPPAATPEPDDIEDEAEPESDTTPEYDESDEIEQEVATTPESDEIEPEPTSPLNEDQARAVPWLWIGIALSALIIGAIVARKPMKTFLTTKSTKNTK